jgi:hypothetical protein
LSTKPFLVIAAFIFFIVGLLHLLRLLYRWPVQFDAWTVPGWVSYFGLVVAWGLSAWAYHLCRKGASQ